MIWSFLVYIIRSRSRAKQTVTCDPWDDTPDVVDCHRNGHNESECNYSNAIRSRGTSWSEEATKRTTWWVNCSLSSWWVNCSLSSWWVNCSLS